MRRTAEPIPFRELMREKMSEYFTPDHKLGDGMRNEIWWEGQWWSPKKNGKFAMDDTLLAVQKEVDQWQVEHEKVIDRLHEKIESGED